MTNIRDEKEATEPAGAGSERVEAGDKTAPEAHVDGAPPKLADGIELIGEYQDSGFKEPPSIARRADGQVVQLPAILYSLAEEIDGRRGYEELAERASEKIGRGLSADDTRMLVEEKLVPLGVVAGADGAGQATQAVDPLLGLKFRTALVPKGVVKALTTVFYPLFFPLVIVMVVAGLVAVDIWLFFFHGVGQPTRELIYNPLLLLMVFGLVVVATAFHEVGHATAARYGGAEPGVMGAGIYVVWPAFYTDVTDAYRLGRWGRVRTDLGGIYFNAIFVLAIAGAYFLTGFEPLLLLILIQHLQVIQQLLPFLRLDGYYVLSDLTGVPDMFSRIKPTLSSLVPGRERDDRVEELKPWVRVVTMSWVALLIPVLLLIFGVMLVNAPRIFATAWDSFVVHYDDAREGFGGGSTLAGVVDSMQMAMLALPAAGMVYSFTRAGARIGAGAWAWSQDAPFRRLGVLATGAAALALLGFVWWPNGDYRPVQRGERGTVQGGFAQLREIPSGRPALTPQRERELDGAPTLREQRREQPAEEPAPPEESGTAPAATETTPTATTLTETGQTETGQTETGSAETTPTVTGQTETGSAETTTVETTTTATTETTTTTTTP